MQSSTEASTTSAPAQAAHHAYKAKALQKAQDFMPCNLAPKQASITSASAQATHHANKAKALHKTSCHAT